jgi:hypothetical protein
LFEKFKFKVNALFKMEIKKPPSKKQIKNVCETIVNQKATVFLFRFDDNLGRFVEFISTKQWRAISSLFNFIYNLGR